MQGARGTRAWGGTLLSHSRCVHTKSTQGAAGEGPEESMCVRVLAWALAGHTHWWVSPLCSAPGGQL